MEPLNGEEETKKPIILYIIIIVLLIVIVVLSILLALKSNADPENVLFNPIRKEHFIQVKQPFYLNFTKEDGGAYSYNGLGNHLDSEYFKILDIYNMQPTETRAILSHFKTYQQTSEFSSPCSLIIMILTYYNLEPPGERDCSLDFGLTPEEYQGTYNRTDIFNKCTPQKIAEHIFSNYGLEVETTANYTYDHEIYQDVENFGIWVKNNIKEGNIIIVLHNDWAGQYTAIIGIDDIGTNNTADDVLIMADSYDTTDHLQDGYIIWSLEKFYYLWRDTVVPFYKDDDEINHGQFILIKKPKNN